MPGKGGPKQVFKLYIEKIYARPSLSEQTKERPRIPRYFVVVSWNRKRQIEGSIAQLISALKQRSSGGSDATEGLVFQGPVVNRGA